MTGGDRAGRGEARHGDAGPGEVRRGQVGQGRAGTSLILDVLERRDPAYRAALEWHCPDCGCLLNEAEGGMFCERCERHWTWTELGKDEAAWD